MTNEQIKVEFREAYPDTKLSREVDGIKPMPSDIPNGLWWAAIAGLTFLLIVSGAAILRYVFGG